MENVDEIRKLVEAMANFPTPARWLMDKALSPSRANDHLTLSDAHRLLSVLRDETQSRAVHAECEDVMARLSQIVEGGAGHESMERDCNRGHEIEA